MKIDVRGCALRNMCHTVGDADGTIDREEWTPKKHRRRFVFFGRKIADSRKDAEEYAREHGGTVFNPKGEPIAEFGPARYWKRGT